MKFRNLFVWTVFAVMGPATLASAESSDVQFRILGWDVAPTTLFLQREKEVVPVSLAPRTLSPAYRGPKLLRFSNQAMSGEGNLTFEVVIPDDISTALLLFQSSGSQTTPGYKVIVIDDSLAAFPINQIRCINLTAFPIKVDLLQAPQIVAPSKSALWPISKSPGRTRMSLSLEADSRWKEFTNSTLDLEPQKRLNLLTFSQAGPVAVESRDENGSPVKLLVHPEQRPAHWFAIWDVGFPENKTKQE